MAHPSKTLTADDYPSVREHIGALKDTPDVHVRGPSTPSLSTLAEDDAEWKIEREPSLEGSVRVTFAEAVSMARQIAPGTLARVRLDVIDEPVWQVVLRTAQDRLFELLIDAHSGRVLAAAYLPYGTSSDRTYWTR
jgi:uncharacterized membrane protein YkoI